MALWRLPYSAERPTARCPRLEGELQVVYLSQLVVHLEERLDDGLDLVRHPVELLEGDPLELAPHLLVEVEQAAEASGRHEAAIDLLVGGEYPLESVADTVAGCPDFLHTFPGGEPSSVQFGCHGTT